MFPPSSSPIDSDRGDLSVDNNVTSRVKRSKRKSTSNFRIPPIFSFSKEGTSSASASMSTSNALNATPSRMTIKADRSRSRTPFSPLTNSIDRRALSSNEFSSRKSDGTIKSASKSASTLPSPKILSKTKRIIDFEASVNSKKSRVGEDTNKPDTSISIHNVANNYGDSSIELQEQMKIQKQGSDLEYEIIIPGDIKLSPFIFESAYKQALKNGTHQNNLRSINCNELSFTEVIIPSIFRVCGNELKRMEGKAKGRKAVNVAKQIRFYRCVLKNCEEEMIFAAEKAREAKHIELNREKELRFKLEREQEEELERRKKEDTINRKERAKETAKQQRERNKLQKKKELKKNRELWKEVATLMTELVQIEKEEKMWRELDVNDLISEVQLKEFKSSATTSSENQVSDDNTTTSQRKELEEQGERVQFLIDGITTSAYRIHQALQSLPLLLEQTEVVRDELYYQYKNNHKFEGYRAHKNPKALIRALTLD